MFKLNTEIGEIEVSHTREISEISSKIDLNDIRQVQFCVIKLEGMEYYGEAVLNPRDIYNDAKGRKVAFQDALEELSTRLELTKAQKKDIWDKWREAEWLERVEEVIKERYPQTKVNVVHEEPKTELIKPRKKVYLDRLNSMGYYVTDNKDPFEAKYLHKNGTLRENTVPYDSGYYKTAQDARKAAELGGFELVESY